MKITYTQKLSNNCIVSLYELLETTNNYKPQTNLQSIYSLYCKNNNVLQSFCLLDDYEVIGCAQLFYYSRLQGMLVGMIEDVVVKNTFQNQGIGTNLIKNIIANAREKNIKKISLASSISGKDFYPKLGFKEKRNFFNILI